MTVEAFNEYLSERTDVAPIPAEKLVASRVEDGAAKSAYANAAEFLPLSEQVEKLASFPIYRAGPTIGLPAGPNAPAGDFTQARARDALNRIEDLKTAPGQDAVELFHEKCRLMGNILTAPLDDESRRLAIAEAAGVLGDPTVLQRAPAEWLAEVRDLLKQIRAFELLGPLGSRPKEQPASAAELKRSAPLSSDLVNALATSRLSALSLYGRIELFGLGM